MADVKIVCKNIFKNRDKVAFVKEYNKKWIELINQHERKNNEKNCDDK